MTDRREVHWLWFAAWAAVGILYAVAVLGVLSIGLLVMPVAVAATVLLGRRSDGWVGTPGVLSGLAVPLLAVAYLNREGPGEVCHSTAQTQSCSELWNPWPFVAVAVALLVAGVVGERMRHRFPPGSGDPSPAL
jgi:hypothetical protein